MYLDLHQMNQCIVITVKQSSIGLLPSLEDMLMWCLFTDRSALPRLPADTTRMVDPVSATRIVCGAVVLPSCAVLCGNLLFRSVRSNIQRSMMVWTCCLYVLYTGLFSPLQNISPHFKFTLTQLYEKGDKRENGFTQSEIGPLTRAKIKQEANISLYTINLSLFWMNLGKLYIDVH